MSNKYDDFELEDIIKLYASIQDDWTLDTERTKLHEALCRKLGVSPFKFRPLDDLFPPVMPEYAEAHLRRAIDLLKKGKWKAEFK